MDLTVEEAAVEICELLQQKAPMTLLCGAGISVAAPACAPAWIEFRNGLVRAVLQYLGAGRYLTQGSLDSLNDKFVSFGRSFANKLIISPEALLDEFYSIMNDRLFVMFRVLDEGAPNRNHEIVAGLCRSGHVRAIITTNFDLYLERALDSVQVQRMVYTGESASEGTLPIAAILRDRRDDRAVPIIKIHGTLAQAETIKAAVRQVGHALTNLAGRSLSVFLEAHHVVVLGYSGNDYDVFPFLQAALPMARSVYWLARSKDSMKPESARLRGNTALVVGDLCVFLENVRNGMKLPCLPGQGVGTMESVVKQALSDRLLPYLEGFDYFTLAYGLERLGMTTGFYDLSDAMFRGIARNKRIGIRDRARALNVSAITCSRRDPSSAMRRFRKAERLAREIRQEYPSLYGNILGGLASHLHERGAHREALHLLKRSDYWARKGSKPQHLLAQNMNDRGNVYRALGRPKRAIECHRAAESVHRSSGYLKGVAKALSNEGLSWMDLGRYEVAEALFTESISLRNQITSDFQALARVRLDMSEALIGLRKYKESVAQLREALRLAREFGDYVVEADVYYSVAEACRLSGHQSIGERFLRRGEDLAGAIPDWRGDKYRLARIKRIAASFRGGK